MEESEWKDLNAMTKRFHEIEEANQQMESEIQQLTSEYIVCASC